MQRKEVGPPFYNPPYPLGTITEPPTMKKMVEVIGEVEIGEKISVDHAIIPYWRVLDIAAVVEIRDLETLKYWLKKHSREKPLDELSIEFPVYCAKATQIYIISKSSYLDITKPNRYMKKLVRFLKYNPTFGAEMNDAKEHFEENTKQS